MVLILYNLVFVFVLQDRNNAQSSCAGLFIGAHLGFNYPGVWIHIDMAAPVHSVRILVTDNLINPLHQL